MSTTVPTHIWTLPTYLYGSAPPEPAVDPAIRRIAEARRTRVLAVLREPVWRLQPGRAGSGGSSTGSFHSFRDFEGRDVCFSFDLTTREEVVHFDRINPRTDSVEASQNLPCKTDRQLREALLVALSS